MAKHRVTQSAFCGVDASAVRPLAAITGILLGSCLAITVSLAAVMLVFLILGDDYPRLSYEFRGLAASLAIFFVMTSICALSFYAELTLHRFRMVALLAMCAGLLATGWYYWP